MANKLYLHIGMNKTGSTSIQNYLSSNYEFFRKNGLLYPKAGRAKHAHFGLSTALGFHNKKDLPDEAKLNDLKQSLESEINDFKGSIVLSSENFIKNKTLKQVEKFFRGYDVYVVIYLRRHDLWWESSYSQALKMVNNPPWNKGINNYIKFSKNRGIGNYRSIVDKWSNVFGTEKVIVKPFEKSQIHNGLVKDFLETVGLINQNYLPDEPQLANSSLSLKAMELLEIIQRLDVSAKEKTDFVNFINANPKMKSKDSLLGIQQRIDIYEDNIEDYKYIAQTYLNRKDGILFNDVNFEKSHAEHSNQTGITNIEVCEIFMDYIKNC